MKNQLLYSAMAAVLLGPVVAQAAVAPPTSATILIPDDAKQSTYTVSLVSHVGKTWTYNVSQVQGRTLSHWVLGINNCLSNVVSSSPTADQIGTDPSTAANFVGIKWNTAGGTFSFTLDKEYAETTLQAFVKTATVYNTGSIVGPDCSSPVVTTPTTPTTPTTTPTTPTTSTPTGGTGHILTSQTLCASQASTDSYAFSNSQGHAAWIPGIAADLVFSKDAPGKFIENADGTATFTGTLVRASDPKQSFTLNVTFTGAQTTAPGEIKKELDAKAYNEGKADIASWYFYTGFQGTLTGTGSYAGSQIKVTRIGPAFQVGTGANGKNVHFGASGWFSFDIVSQPTNTAYKFYKGGEHGDFNIDLNPCAVQSTTTTLCAYRAYTDKTYGQYSGGHSVWMPNIATDLIFLDSAPGVLVEDSAKGNAKLTGTLVRASNAKNGFVLDANLSGLQTTMPSGSPKKELVAKAYSEKVVKPETWYFYTGFTGTLTGFGDYAGAKLNFVRMGPALQLGNGANGKNLNFGGSSWFNYTVVSQPTKKSIVFGGDRGDFNLDIKTCPTPK